MCQDRDRSRNQMSDPNLFISLCVLCLAGVVRARASPDLLMKGSTSLRQQATVASVMHQRLIALARSL